MCSSKWLLLFVLCSTGQAIAQNGDLLFNESILHRIDVTIAPSNWFDILENDYKNNARNPDSFPEIYRSCDVKLDGVMLSQCGIREKGNSSNTLNNGSKKKPFKISFDEFLNQKYDGLKKINLSNFTNDPSLVHEVLSYKLYRGQGLVAPRTAYTELYFNGIYWGLYLIIENVDKTFLKYHYGDKNNNGNLYKTDREAKVLLNWLGPYDSLYVEQGLELKTNETVNDWSKLFHFLEGLNTLPDDRIEAFIDSFFDIHQYLKILATEKCIKHWDSYWGNANNFYLYEHPDGKIRWIPWDMNETFQDLKVINATGMLDGYLIPTKQMDERPLIKRIFSIEHWKQEYLENVCQLIHSYFTDTFLGPTAVLSHNLVDEAYKRDFQKLNSYASFQNSLTHTHKDVVNINKSSYQITLRYPGIFPFIQTQREWAVSQLMGWEKECALEKPKHYALEFYPNPTHDELYIKSYTSNFDFASLVFYSTSGIAARYNSAEMFQNGVTKIDLPSLSPGIYTVVKTGVGGDVGYGRIVIW